MQIFVVGKNRFAIGKNNKRANYVVQLKRGKYVGVRGQRPILNDRFKTVKGNKALREALTAASE